LSDSTANQSTEWFHQVVQWIGTHYPAYSITEHTWSDANQRYDFIGDSSLIDYPVQTGTAGDAYYTQASGKYVSLADAASNSITGDMDVRMKVSFDVWPPAAETNIASKFGGAGQRSWRFGMYSNGLLYVQTSADGTNLIDHDIGTAPSVTAGTPLFLRFTIDVNNGASGHDVKTYSSTDGLSWSQVGSTKTVAGTTSIFDSTAAVELGGRSGGSSTLLVGNVYYFELRNGIAGAPVAAIDMDDYNPSSPTTITDRLGNSWAVNGTPTFGGAPGIIVYNTATSGVDITYAYDGTRFPKLTPGKAADATFIAYGHNDSFAGFGDKCKVLADTLIAKWSSSSIVFVTQNPQASPRTTAQINAMTGRVQQMRQYAAASGLGLIDVNRYWVDSGSPSAWINAGDGIHPTQAGMDYWASVVEKAFAAWK